jgi:hypothetical protein
MAATSYGYTGLSGSPVVARNVFHDHRDTFLVVDFANSSKSHAYTQSFNLFTNNTTGYGNGGIRTRAGNGDVLLLPLVTRGQTTRIGRALLTDTAPPAGLRNGTRFAVNQTAAAAVFATVMVTFDNGRVPSVSARWLRMPTAKRAGQVEITRNGVKTVVTIVRPDLTTGGRAKSAAVAAETPAAIPTPAIKPFAFSTKPVGAMDGEDALLD